LGRIRNSVYCARKVNIQFDTAADTQRSANINTELSVFIADIRMCANTIIEFACYRYIGTGHFSADGTRYLSSDCFGGSTSLESRIEFSVLIHKAYIERSLGFYLTCCDTSLSVYL